MNSFVTVFDVGSARLGFAPSVGCSGGSGGGPSPGALCCCVCVVLSVEPLD